MSVTWLRAMSYLEDILNVVPAAVLAGAIYCAARFFWLKKTARRRAGWGAELIRLLLVCYLAALLSLVWLPGNFWRALWWKLRWGYFGEIRIQWFGGSFSFVPSFHNLWQTAANVLLYVPLGALLPAVWKRGWQIPAAGLALSLVTELVQPVVGRSFDTADLVANTAGTLAGWLLFHMIWAAARRFREKK